LWFHSKPRGLERVFSTDELSRLAGLNQNPARASAFYEFDFPGGACVIRREIFHKIGFFDEGFWYGGEECDFAYRCHRDGVRLLRDTSLWVIHLRSPDMRIKNGTDLGLKNYIIAQSRYMPFTDLCLFLMFQFLKSALVAIQARKIRSFCWICWQVIKEWRSRVSMRRKPVSRRTMWSWYYLRVNQPERFPDGTSVRTTPLEFYVHRARIWIMDQDEPRQFVTMLPEATLGQDCVTR